MRNWLWREGLPAEWGAKAMRRLEEVFPEDDHRNRGIWRLYLAHVRYMLGCESPEDDEEERRKLTRKFARCLYSDGRYNEAEPWHVRMMEMSKRVLGDEHPSTLTSMANLASTYRNQGRWKEAEELFVQVLETKKRVLGKEHPDTLTSMANLAFTLKSQSRDEEALSLLETCFQLSEQILGEQHPYTKLSLTALEKSQAEKSKAGLQCDLSM